MADTLIQPFRRNLTIAPIIIPAGDTPIATAVPLSNSTGVTSFIMHNPNQFWCWYAGWRGAAGEMPAIRGAGHYIAPGASYVGRTQMPQWIAAQADDEVAFPIYDAQGAFLYAGKRNRLVILYGSGS